MRRTRRQEINYNIDETEQVKKTMSDKQLSNPFSTGGGGVIFETHVQASFVALMLTGGYAPCLPCWPIVEIKLQGKIEGFQTDDLIVSVEDQISKKRRKMLGQIKHSIKITKGDKVFGEVIQAAWKDFNNPKIFNRNEDIIALLTGPLSATDSHNTQWLLNHARHTKSAAEFFRDINQANFSPPKSKEKLDAIIHHITSCDDETSNEDLYSFLKHFYLLGYDLDENGVVLSLLHSHISQFNREYPIWIWPRVVNVVQEWNTNAGTIISDKLPDDLKDAFRLSENVPIPNELANIQPKFSTSDFSQYQYASLLAITNLIGAWDENKEADINAVNEIINEDYSSWILKAREMLQLTNSPFSLQNGYWKIVERRALWKELGTRIFDPNLDSFKKAIVSVLTERDPSFKFLPKEHYLAGIHNKVLTHSTALRRGMAEGLALLGSEGEVLTNCSRDKAEVTAHMAIREIFKNSDWALWGSLNNLLPTLAEASPDAFLDAVEKDLHSDECPFDVLFSQEGDVFTGGNYLTGLLWALEGLAWGENYLVRVCIILGELSSHDPGGKWANRPANSLKTILLPWFPQTLASIEKRKAAVQTLCKECPDIAWHLIIKLLPNQSQTTSGSYKPKWRNPIPEDWKESVIQSEYWEQVSFYAEAAVFLAGTNIARLIELIDKLNNLPRPSFNRLLEILSSEDISELPEEKRFLLWNSLIKFVTRHRRFSEAKWALNNDLLTLIEAVADKLAPSRPIYLYQHLFNDPESGLYEEKGNWEEQRENLNQRRQKAIREILNSAGLDEVIRLAERVQFPAQVGGALGGIANEEFDKELLPAYLDSDNRTYSDFIRGYIWRRYHNYGWEWADALDKAAWKTGQISQFLSSLPFHKETWIRATQWLGHSENAYWEKTNVNSFQADEDLAFAIDKLIENGRPHAAIECLDTMMQFTQQSIRTDQCIWALRAALSSSESSYSIDTYRIVELIKALQGSPEVPLADLIQVEWAYLSLLDHYDGATPKTLEAHLADDPDFFCEVIQLIYRSNKAENIQSEISEAKQAMASNAWRLLHNWSIPPGMQEDGSFSEEKFSAWLQRVKESCTESGHLEVALIQIGEVLIHCPPDPEGLWINRVVAEALNARDAENIRQGYSTGIFNSRGGYFVDPTGKPERELAGQYRQKADEVENAGYQRLAVTLRKLAETYEREASHIVAGLEEMGYKRGDDSNTSLK